jgi:hypothetical protein
VKRRASATHFAGAKERNVHERTGTIGLELGAGVVLATSTSSKSNPLSPDGRGRYYRGGTSCGIIIITEEMGQRDHAG